MRVSAPPEPTAEDLDRIVDQLKRSWTAAITIRRQSREDVGYREIFLSLDGQALAMLNWGDAVTKQIAPGTHRLHAHNTLFKKTLEFTVNVGEHASFTAVNRAGLGTYSSLALIIGFLGAGPLYLTLERDELVASE